MSAIFFYDEKRAYHGERPQQEDLALWQEYGTLADSNTLINALSSASHGSCFVNTHGPFFPSNAWPALLYFLQNGGNLVSLGNMPFSQPCPLFKDLNIHEMLAIDNSDAQSIEAGTEYPLLADKTHLFQAQASTCGFVLMPTKHKDCPKESSSSGPMDARIYPLITANDTAGRAIAAPVVLIENHRGIFAGSRWLFANIDSSALFWEQGGGEALLDWAKSCAKGTTEIWIKPDFACYYPSEVPTYSLQLEALRPNACCQWQIEITTRYAGKVILQETLALTTHINGPVFHRSTLPTVILHGYYAIHCKAISAFGEVREMRQGFWGRDHRLLEEGQPLSAGRDYFTRGGKPVPIVGMTYMASDVHRKFLQLPNPAAWDEDMAEFARMGINYIRTGIWTAWRQIMFADGHAQEAALRAIDAFLHCAKRHNLETCFTFFTFTPETWEGHNPYLDPRAIAAQKRFISAIVSRHKNTSYVHWDLINEPSMFNPEQIFLGPRSVQDPVEIAAFRNWLQQQHSDINIWQQRWGQSPTSLPDWHTVLPPNAQEVAFNPTEISPKQHGIWLDYTLFTQAMHKRWVNDLRSTLSAIAPQRLVTVGQDEALGMQRPSPMFFADEVDYTNVHSWWLNDDLAWDSIFSKTPNKPSLVQETGIMHIESPNGRSKRSETELAYMLERKYAYAFINGGAGAVQWLWNINYHMDNINESHIGACRADGTRKPEAMISEDYGSFFKTLAPLMKNRQLEDIAVIYPFSNDYGNRRFALEATQRLVRVMQYELKMPVRAISEYKLSDLDHAPAKLIIIPSPHALSQAARDWIQQCKTPILLTGPCDLDAYWQRCSPLLSESATCNLQREEVLHIGSQKYRASFGGNKIAKLCKGNASTQLQTSGNLLWCPLPLEMNERTEPLLALYQAAMDWAGISAPFHWLSGEQPGVFAQKLSFEQGALWILVNESGQEEAISFSDKANNMVYSLTLASQRAVLFATDAEGKVTARLRKHKVSHHLAGTH
ncbi:beta-galactosidase [Iodobacter fluviatilis]|uniref:Glycoside hydrolase n=1 Tax=Iodobacter fluviatilis TaxID=537 RepID=A0A7G3GBX5_9NEIS|nr:beta-galactosidase [Iodobacter fluviatilis]QBC45080.1 glycoside hydrolase [Iodobacter fluviatilis]